jgi:amino acid transporter
VKKTLIVASSLVAYLSLPFIALATGGGVNVSPCSAPTGLEIPLCAISAAGVGPIIQGVVVLIVIVAVIIALIYLLYGGIKWIMSKGDKTEVESARNHITAAITGLIVVFLAIFIIFLIATLFGINLNTGLILPSL